MATTTTTAKTERPMTYVVCIQNLLDGKHDEATVNRAMELIQSLSSKNATKSKANAARDENYAKLGVDVLAHMEGERNYTIAELATLVPTLVEPDGQPMSAQRIVKILTPMVEAATLIKTVKNRKNLYRLAV